MRLVIRNGNCFDTDTLAFTGTKTLVAEDGLIAAVGEDAKTADVTIDAKGAYMLPGFIDAHVHFRLTTLESGDGG